MADVTPPEELQKSNQDTASNVEDEKESEGAKSYGASVSENPVSQDDDSIDSSLEASELNFSSTPYNTRSVTPPEELQKSNQDTASYVEDENESEGAKSYGASVSENSVSQDDDSIDSSLEASELNFSSSPYSTRSGTKSRTKNEDAKRLKTDATSKRKRKKRKSNNSEACAGPSNDGVETFVNECETSNPLTCKKGEVVAVLGKNNDFYLCKLLESFNSKKMGKSGNKKFTLVKWVERIKQNDNSSFRLGIKETTCLNKTVLQTDVKLIQDGNILRLPKSELDLIENQRKIAIDVINM